MSCVLSIKMVFALKYLNFKAHKLKIMLCGDGGDLLVTIFDQPYYPPFQMVPIARNQTVAIRTLPEETQQKPNITDFWLIFNFIM